MNSKRTVRIPTRIVVKAQRSIRVTRSVRVIQRHTVVRKGRKP